MTAMDKRRRIIATKVRTETKESDREEKKGK